MTYISGGNTFYILKQLKKLGLISILKKAYNKGTILSGLSAGAIIMSKDISMASIPKSTADENKVKLKNIKSLGLLNFHICPHFDIKYKKEILNKTKKGVLAIPDDTAVIIQNNKIIYSNKDVYILRWEIL
jgi:dipeptidase E